MKNMKITILIGCPGSGKSTFVKYCAATKVISRDLIRESLGFVKKGEKALLSKDQETEVTAEWWKQLESCVEEDNVVIDDTNLNVKFRNEMLERIKKIHPEAEILGVIIDAPLHLVLERRKGQIPEKVLRRMYKAAQKVNSESLGGYPLMVYPGYPILASRPYIPYIGR